MDRETDRRMNGWTNGQTGRYTDDRTDRQANKDPYLQTDGQTDKRRDGQTTIIFEDFVALLPFLVADSGKIIKTDIEISLCNRSIICELAYSEYTSKAWLHSIILLVMCV